MCLVFHVTCFEIAMPAKHQLYGYVSIPVLDSQKGRASETRYTIAMAGWIASRENKSDI